MTAIYDFTVRDIAGREVPLSDYRGKALLIVNTASKCGFTPQYEGLEALYRELGPRGLVVLGFPCNQFGAQEPGDAAEIASFCKLTYDVTFPMFAKIEVNGPEDESVLRLAQAASARRAGSKAIKWNFTKFLVDRQRHVDRPLRADDKPEAIREAIETLL